MERYIWTKQACSRSYSKSLNLVFVSDNSKNWLIAIKNNIRSPGNVEYRTKHPCKNLAKCNLNKLLAYQDAYDIVLDIVKN